MGMVKRGAELDTARAVKYFVTWWRNEGGLIAASSAPLLQIPTKADVQGDPYPSVAGDNSSAVDPKTTQGWGFDFQWEVRPEDVRPGRDGALMIQEKMENCIDEYLINTEREEREEGNVSATQRKKRLILEEKEKRKLKYSKR